MEKIMLSDAPLFFLVAGESSGDLLGARLMAALRTLTDGKARFSGIGGPRMQAEGMDLLFPQSELALFGLAELLPKIPHILKRLRETEQAARKLNPAAVITIDAPDFSFRLGKKLKDSRIPLIHYVAPTVWAWRPGRARKIAKFLDGILTLFPFEPPYFIKEGLRAEFVGHSLVEVMAANRLRQDFLAANGFDETKLYITLLPGSRMSEVTKLIPDFRETISRLRTAFPPLVCFVPLAPGVANHVRDAMKDWPAPAIFLEKDSDKYGALAASQAALAASGTVALELALAQLPAVIAYRIHPITRFLYERFIHARYVNLVNIMHGRMAVPELIQDYCRPEFLAAALSPLLRGDERWERQKKDLHDVASWLGAGGEPPAMRAGRAVLEIVAANRS